MKKIIFCIASILVFNDFASAQENEQYPNISGQILFESRNDRVIKINNQGIKSNSAFINIEPDFSLNINNNWSIKTGWRILPVYTRQYNSPERSRTIFGQNRGINQDETGIIIEELKIDYENEDMRVNVGKINPTFATAYRRTKRIGLFVTDITEDYELREKLGFNIAALLDNSTITFNNFFNDTTGLSNSAITHRKRENRNDGLAGNTGTLSSYSITMEGKNLLGVKNLFYNFGYRSLGVDQTSDQNAREKGYTANVEYLQKVGDYAALIPAIEIVKLNNFTGLKNRNANYITTSLTAKYSGWNASIANVYRNIDNNYSTAARTNSRDNLFQICAGYKFKNGISVDISRAELKEDYNKGSLLGLMISYLYSF